MACWERSHSCGVHWRNEIESGCFRSGMSMSRTRLRCDDDNGYREFAACW
jgi:hypothetical protein